MNIKEIAQLAGVAPSTVSKVINNYPGVSSETREKVNAAIEKNNYTSNMNARILSMKKSNLIGILLPNRSSFGIDSPFQAVLLEGFRKIISGLGYDTVFVSKNILGKNVSYLDHCKYMNLAGVLLLAYDNSDTDVLEVINANIPIVSTNFRGNNSVCEIYSDDYRGSVLATEYLIRLGHKSIGYIYGPTDNSNSANVRLDAFKETMVKYNLDILDNFIENTNQYSFDEGFSAMEKILARETCLPTAFVIGSDLIAYGVIKSLRSHGYNVPDDLSIIGFDDLDSSKYIEPALTTIRQDLKKIGECAAISLVNIIENNKLTENIILPVELIIRNSCKRVISNNN